LICSDNDWSTQQNATERIKDFLAWNTSPNVRFDPHTHWSNDAWTFCQCPRRRRLNKLHSGTDSRAMDRRGRARTPTRSYFVPICCSQWMQPRLWGNFYQRDDAELHILHCATLGKHCATLPVAWDSIAPLCPPRLALRHYACCLEGLQKLQV